MISIIIPLYNSEEYIAPCLESVLKQSYDDYEVLVIDDGSKDASADIVAEYSKSNSKIKLFSQSNSGVSAARKKGVEFAQGEWIMFLDSDDILLHNALEVLMRNTVGVDVINASIIGTNGRIWIHERLGLMNHDEYIYSLIDASTYAVPYARLFRRDYVAPDDLNFPANIKVGEDVLMNLKIAKKISCARNISDVIYCYRNHDLSAMSSYSRSVLYLKRYYELRDRIINTEQKKYSLPFDVEMMLKAYFDDNIPYKRMYMDAIRGYFLSIVSDLQVVDSQIKTRVCFFLSHRYFMIFKKLYHYYKATLLRGIVRCKKRTILD